MPIHTRILDNGNFVRSPELPPKAAFSEYLNFADRLLAQWRRVQEDWNRSPFSAELGSEKRELDRVLSDFVETFNALYTITSVERDPAFLPASRFLTQYRPIRQPFSILHCDRAMPLHTVLAFPDHGELAKVNAALDEDTPLRWWESGPHGRPCYLFGSWVWELRPSEIALSEEGMVLLFLDLSERHRQEQGRLAHPASPTSSRRRPGGWSGAGPAASARSAGGTTGSISRASPRPALAAKAPPTTSSCFAAAAVR